MERARAFEKSSSPARSGARGHCIERSLSGLMISRASVDRVFLFSCFRSFLFLSLSLSLSLIFLLLLLRASHERHPHLRAEARSPPRVSNERLNSPPPPRGFPRSHSFPRVPPGSVIFGTFENAVVPATETPDPRGNSDAVTPTLRSSDAIHIPAVIADVCPVGKVPGVAVGRPPRFNSVNAISAFESCRATPAGPRPSYRFLLNRSRESGGTRLIVANLHAGNYISPRDVATSARSFSRTENIVTAGIRIDSRSD